MDKIEPSELMVVVPLKDYTELVAGKATAEAERANTNSRNYYLGEEIKRLKAEIEALKGERGDDLK